MINIDIIVGGNMAKLHSPDKGTKRAQKKEKIRGPKLSVLVEGRNYSGGVDMEEALKRAEDSGRAMASNRRISEAFASGEWKGLRGNGGQMDEFEIWTGTMIGFDEPEKGVGEVIVDVDNSEYPYNGRRYIFPVPEEHRGKKNIVLVAEHPNYTLETDGKDRIVVADRVDVVENLPYKMKVGWFMGDPEHDIPSGSEVPFRTPNAVYLMRMLDIMAKKRVGLVDRHFSDSPGAWFYRHSIGIHPPRAQHKMVLVEEP